MQVYRLNYPGKLPAVFNLEVEEEDGGYEVLPEFYLYTLVDVNGRTTFYIEGKLGVDDMLCLFGHYSDSIRTFNYTALLFRHRAKRRLWRKVP